MLMNPEKSVLLIIDMQEKLLDTVEDSDHIFSQCVLLTRAANVLKIPVLMTRQYPQGLGDVPSSLKNLVLDKNIYDKDEFSCLQNEAFAEALKQTGREQIILCGIEAHICVLQTAMDLKQNGYTPFVAGDAAASRALTNRAAAITRLCENHIEVITSEMALFEWMKTSKSPGFKEIQGLLKKQPLKLTA